VLAFVQIPPGRYLRNHRTRDFAGLTLFDLSAPAPHRGHPPRAASRRSIFLDVLNVFFLFVSIFGRGGD